MTAFMNEDFLLRTPAAQRLYHEYAAAMPIIDYHCHLNPKEIYENPHYDNISQAMLGGDHYKWRLMRANGAAEVLVTGDADPFDKWQAFAAVMPRSIGNPVYHWTHLELKRYFGCDAPLTPATAREIYDHCNKILRDELPPREMIRRANVTDVLTTDDPADDLRWHEALAADESFSTDVRPAWRPEKALHIDQAAFAPYMEKLGRPATMEALRATLSDRMDFFAAHGCTASDHGMTSLVAVPVTEAELDDILQRGLNGEAVTPREADAYRFALLTWLGSEYARRGWTMELHFGVTRNNYTRYFETIGPDTGFDSIAPYTDLSGLPKLLDGIGRAGALPKTVLFSLDPNHNAMLNAVAGCFPIEGVRGAVQQGTAWWFNDSKPGMENQLRTMMSTTVLGSFLGMLTDSRSFLSYTRHEYFRRILCNMLGELIDAGEYPADFDSLGPVVQDVCYNNARAFFCAK